MSAQNYTIDDALWGTAAVALSAGWNMLRVNGADDYVNATQVAAVTPVLGQCWNSSLSWTTTAGASTTLEFVGTDIWAYGLALTAGGNFTAVLDRAPLGTYSTYAAAQTARALVLAVSGLADAAHTLELVNDVAGTWLTFDYAVVQSTAAFESSAVATAASAASASAASASAASASAAAAASASAALAASEAAMAAEAGMTWSAAQLSELTATYVFHWNAAAVFTVAAACVFGLVAAVIAGAVVLRLPRCPVLRLLGESADAGSTAGQASSATSFVPRALGGRARPGSGRHRPATRVLDAIRGRKISAPRSVDDHASVASTGSIGKEVGDAELGHGGAW